ncbi:hypothetical protein HK101_009060 [Irineochytrium annulatum]|nr:hypothetical protein HK101_009060 [Irineochytrium annulatum]
MTWNYYAHRKSCPLTRELASVNDERAARENGTDAVTAPSTPKKKSRTLPNVPRSAPPIAPRTDADTADPHLRSRTPPKRAVADTHPPSNPAPAPPRLKRAATDNSNVKSKHTPLADLTHEEIALRLVDLRAAFLALPGVVSCDRWSYLCTCGRTIQLHKKGTLGYGQGHYWGHRKLCKGPDGGVVREYLRIEGEEYGGADGMEGWEGSVEGTDNGDLPMDRMSKGSRNGAGRVKDRVTRSRFAKHSSTSLDADHSDDGGYSPMPDWGHPDSSVPPTALWSRLADPHTFARTMRLTPAAWGQPDSWDTVIACRESLAQDHPHAIQIGDRGRIEGCRRILEVMIGLLDWRKGEAIWRCSMEWTVGWLFRHVVGHLVAGVVGNAELGLIELVEAGADVVERLEEYASELKTAEETEDEKIGGKRKWGDVEKRSFTAKFGPGKVVQATIPETWFDDYIDTFTK